MSARSFYIAASSSEDGVKAAKSLASRLEGAGLMVSFPWWEHLGADPAALPSLAAMDVASAVGCDVFVLLSEPASYGACVELGARLAADRGVYMVGPGGHELFARHPLVRRVESVDVLLAVLAGEGEGA